MSADPEFLDENLLENYHIMGKVARGCYGLVWKAKAYSTGETKYAVKRVINAFENRVDAQRVYREIALLLELNGHANIVEIFDVVKSQDDLDIYIVTEFVDGVMVNVLRNTRLLPVHQTFICYQLVRALLYLHTGGILHRDIKPANLLLTKECRLKLCDFGSARTLCESDEYDGEGDEGDGGDEGGSADASSADAGTSTIGAESSATTGAATSADGAPGSSNRPGRPERDISAADSLHAISANKKGSKYPRCDENYMYGKRLDASKFDAEKELDPDPWFEEGPVLTAYMASRWYRAPELLLGSKHYEFPSDMWSAACSLAEMYTISNNVLFKANCSTRQLEKIYECLGAPDEFEKATLKAPLTVGERATRSFLWWML